MIPSIEEVLEMEKLMVKEQKPGQMGLGRWVPGVTANWTVKAQ